MIETLSALRARQRIEEAQLLRQALEASAWNLNAASRLLGCPSASHLQRALERHPELDAERRGHLTKK